MIFTPKKLDFKYRKLLHFSLIAAIVLFQVVLLVIYYNEMYNGAKLASIKKELDQASALQSVINRSKITQKKAQDDLKNFISTHHQTSLDSFRKNAIGVASSLDSFTSISKKATSWSQFLHTNPALVFNQNQLKAKLDSVLNHAPVKTSNFQSNQFSLPPYNYKEVLNSVQVESTKEVDTVKKKGFFSRMGNALAGKVDVQKEKVNVLVTMKFGKEVTTGDVASQLAKAFENTNAYYASSFAALQTKMLSKLHAENKREVAFAAFNMQVLQYSSDLLISYENAVQDFASLTSHRFDKQYTTNTAIRNYTVLAVVILVILISIILFFYTRLAFSYEKRWYNAQLRIQESLHFKDQIVSMISHEIRSPLSIISIYSNYLSAKITEEESKKVFQSIQFTTNSLLTLSNQILEFSKNENNQMKLTTQPFDLELELSGMVTSLRTLVESNANTFSIESTIPKLCLVDSDTVKIHQLLYNAVGNANKFTTNGTIRLAFDLQNYTTSLWNLIVTVEDTGIGISKEDLEHIFDHFYQGAVTEKAHRLGVGLGLNLCKDLVELFDGTIQVTSELNKGTILSFNLILKKG